VGAAGGFSATTAAAGRRVEPVPVGAGQAERLGEPPHRRRPRVADPPGFDLADAADADAGTLGEFLLRQAQLPSSPANQLTEHQSASLRHSKVPTKYR
jgi:hypothetical protein